MHLIRLVLPIVLLSLGACATVKDTVSSVIAKETDNSVPPAELVEFEAQLEVDKVWSGRYGKGVDNLFIQLIPAPYEDKIFTADRDGRVIALDSESGKEVWSERDKSLRISGGPGAGEGMVFVATSDAEVVAYDAESGERKWEAMVSSEVLAPPVASRGTVVIRTGDGKMFGLDTHNGKRRWVYDRTIPVLTLRGTGAPTVYDNMVIAGFDNGRLVALDISSGKQAWETRLAVPSGRSDLERMVDVDAEPVIHDDTVYVATFQASVAAVSVFDGQLEWTREISSYARLAVDDEHVYVTDDQGYVWALERRTGASIWKQEGLRARQVSGPAVFERYVVVGDLDGYLHWLDRDTGEFVQRTRLDRQRILVPCRPSGETLLAISSSGELAAYRPHRKAIAAQTSEP